MGAQHRPPTQKCDTRQAPASMLGGVELSRNLLLCFGGPWWPRVNHPPDFRTTRLCPLAGLLFPWGLGEAHNWVNFRLKDSLSLSEIRSNSPWLIVIGPSICLNHLSFLAQWVWLKDVELDLWNHVADK